MMLPIDKVEALTPHIAKLRAIGLLTLEDVVAAAQPSGSELSKYLGVEIHRVVNAALVEAAAFSPIDPATESKSREIAYTFGAQIDGVSRIEAPSLYYDVDLPASVNHVANLPAPLDQGERGTCVAFSVLAAYDFHLKKLGASHDLSEQFLYWNCKRHDNLANIDATYISTATKWLNYQGSCLELTWAYDPAPKLGNLGHSPPPGGASIEASRFRSSPFLSLSGTDVPSIKSASSSGSLIPISFPVFGSWVLNERIVETGDITMPIPGEVTLGGHAVCIVGYEDDATVPELGGGRFIVRNSWGDRWGTKSQYGVGYGTIPYAYIQNHGVEASHIT